MKLLVHTNMLKGRNTLWHQLHQIPDTQDKVPSTLSSTPAGTTMGLKEREWGQIGVIMMAGTLGWIMEAPAATAYAVLPVGVETMRPDGGHTHRHTVALNEWKAQNKQQMHLELKIHLPPD